MAVDVRCTAQNRHWRAGNGSAGVTVSALCPVWQSFLLTDTRVLLRRAVQHRGATDLKITSGPFARRTPQHHFLAPDLLIAHTIEVTAKRWQTGVNTQ